MIISTIKMPQVLSLLSFSLPYPTVINEYTLNKKQYLILQENNYFSLLYKGESMTAGKVSGKGEGRGMTKYICRSFPHGVKQFKQITGVFYHCKNAGAELQLL